MPQMQRSNVIYATLSFTL